MRRRRFQRQGGGRVVLLIEELDKEEEEVKVDGRRSNSGPDLGWTGSWSRPSMHQDCLSHHHCHPHQHHHQVPRLHADLIHILRNLFNCSTPTQSPAGLCWHFSWDILWNQFRYWIIDNFAISSVNSRSAALYVQMSVCLSVMVNWLNLSNQTT